MNFLGLDVGTQGARAIVCDERGTVKASASAPFARMNTAHAPDRKEQHPDDWIAAAKSVIINCVKQLNGERVDAVSLDATSGTVLAADKNGAPLTDALMYNDARSKAQTEQIKEFSAEHEQKHGYSFSASYALPKLLWIQQELPDVYDKTKMFLHQSDYLYAWLTGRHGVSDYSNALKTGYDLIELKWPDWIGKTGLDTEKLPEVLAPGEIVGTVKKEIAEELGINGDAVVIAGATDGYASSLAAGLSVPGSRATVIGTTMVLKAVTQNILRDEEGRVYCHKHPDGYWLPGGASNVGGECLNRIAPKEKFGEYDRASLYYAPTGDLVYPLSGTGERFPFANPNARGFYVGKTDDTARRYAASMEGVGYLERYAYEMLEQMGLEPGDAVHTSGGACKSPEWLQIRADILNKQLRVPESPEAATGSAMIAAAGKTGKPLSQTVGDMVTVKKTVDPDPETARRYGELYERFKKELSKRKLI